MTELIKFIKENKSKEQLGIVMAEEKWDLVIKSLERETPKKVEGHRDSCSYKFYKCPSCKTDLIMRPQYCDKCGQRLEWEDGK